MVIYLKMAALTANFRKCKLTRSKSALEYAEYACFVFFVTSYLKNRVLPLQVFILEKNIGK